MEITKLISRQYIRTRTRTILKPADVKTWTMLQGQEDVDGSSITIVDATVLNFVSTHNQKDDIVFAKVVPPTLQGGTQKLPHLHALFLGTRGRKCSPSITEAAISWLLAPATSGPATVSPLRTEYLDGKRVVDIVIGLDTETGQRGGIGLIQVGKK